MFSQFCAFPKSLPVLVLLSSLFFQPPPPFFLSHSSAVIWLPPNHQNSCSPVSHILQAVDKLCGGSQSITKQRGHREKWGSKNGEKDSMSCKRGGFTGRERRSTDAGTRKATDRRRSEKRKEWCGEQKSGGRVIFEGERRNVSGKRACGGWDGWNGKKMKDKITRILSNSNWDLMNSRCFTVRLYLAFLRFEHSAPPWGIF